MEKSEVQEKIKEEGINTVEIEEESPGVPEIPKDDDLIQKLRNIRRPLSVAPVKPASGLIEQFQFYDIAGTKQLAVFVDGAWHRVALTLIT